MEGGAHGGGARGQQGAGLEALGLIAQYVVRFFGYFHLERLRVKRRKRREKKRKGRGRKKEVNRLGRHLLSPWRGRWNQLGGSEGEREEMEEVMEEELELLKLLDWPLAGDTKYGTCGKVFDTKKLLYFHERNQHVDPGN